MAVNSKKVVCFVCGFCIVCLLVPLKEMLSVQSGAGLYIRVPVLFNLNSVFMKMCGLFAFAGGMLVGGMVGGALALMFAPKKGEDLRKEIVDKIIDVERQFTDNTTVCKEGQCKRVENVG